MTWMTWRQHRAAATIGAVILAAIAAALVWLGVTARSKVRHYGLTACLHNGTDSRPRSRTCNGNTTGSRPSPRACSRSRCLAGMFWGAPLIAREIETGTYRLVWTQSISRLRWISTKLALVLGVTAAATLAVSMLAVWAFQPLIPVLGNRFRGGWFDVQGIVPAAYMLFALALGACMGAIWRKTIPAMATTIVGFAAVRIPVHNLRRHLISPNTKTIGVTIGNAIARGTAGQRATTTQSPWPAGLGPGDWVLGQTPTGMPTSGPPTKGPPASDLPLHPRWTVLDPPKHRNCDLSRPHRRTRRHLPRRRRSQPPPLRPTEAPSKSSSRHANDTPRTGPRTVAWCRSGMPRAPRNGTAERCPWHLEPT